MRMRERTRSNCGRRYPSTSVAKAEGGETIQGLGTTRHCWRLWLLAYGCSVRAHRRDQKRRLLSSPRVGTLLADLARFKIGKVAVIQEGLSFLSCIPFQRYRYRWRPVDSNDHARSLFPPASITLDVSFVPEQLDPLLNWSFVRRILFAGTS